MGQLQLVYTGIFFFNSDFFLIVIFPVAID